MPWPLNCAAKVMTVVVPPARQAVLPVTKLSSSAPPFGAQLLDMAVRIDAAGQHQQAAGIERLGAVQLLAERGDAPAADADIGAEGIGARSPRCRRAPPDRSRPSCPHCSSQLRAIMHAAALCASTHKTIRPTGRPITSASTASRSPHWKARPSPPRCPPPDIVAFRRTRIGRAARPALRHGRLLRLRGDGRRPHRPARLPDQGRRRHGRDRRGRAAAGPARRRTGSPQSEERACDVLVVGAGPAGLSAAIAAAEAGASVVVLDERSATGGQYAKPLADSHADAAPDAQFRLGNAAARTRARRRRPRSRPRPPSGAASPPTRSPPWSHGARDHVPPAPPDPGTRRARTAGAAARLDAARRDDHRFVADPGPRPTRLPRRARADRRQRSAQPAACLRIAGLRREAARGGGGGAAPRSCRVASGLDDGTRRARSDARRASACC